MSRLLLVLLGPLLATPVLAQRNLAEIPPPDPEIEKASFRVAEGFEVNLWAADPLLAKPTQIRFDSEGRLWVASSETYPQLNVNQEPNDRIIVLEDIDGDGAADQSSVFYDKLIIPGGVLPDGQGGAYVAHAEELIHLTDSDQDGRADKKTVLLSGFGTEDTHHTLHRLGWGPDGLLYMLQGYYIGTHVETLYGPRRLNGGGLWWYNTRTRRLEIYSRGLVNPWGVIFDRWGQTFQTDGAGGEGINYSFPDAVFKASPREHRTLNGLNPGRPKLCGIEVISGSHFPAEWQGSLLANDFRANNIDRYAIEERDSGYISILKEDLLQSTHVSFRPIDLVMGPDGAVYVADWYSPIIQHGEVDFRDKRRDQVHGRIWRISAKDRPLDQPVNYQKLGIQGLLDLLKADADWVRLQAKQTLKYRDHADVEASLKKWVGELDPKDTNYEHQRLEALWTLQTIASERTANYAKELMDSPDHRVRAAAVRVLYFYPDTDPESLTKAVNDTHPRVRREAVTTLGQLRSAKAARLALQALNHPMDAYLDFALWRTCRLLERHWLPAFQRGSLTFGDNADQLAFALKAIENQQAVSALVRLVEERGYQAGPTIIRLIGKIGNREDLDVLITMQNRYAALALVEAAQDRGVIPANEGGLESICAHLLDTNDPKMIGAACRLIGFWKQTALKDKLAKQFDYPHLEILQGAAVGMALLGMKNELAKVANDNLAALPARAAAAASLVRLDPVASAQAAAKLFRQPLDGTAVDPLLGAILVKKEGAMALAKALEGSSIPENTATRAVRLLETSGTSAESLVAAFAKAGGLTIAPQQLDEQQLLALLAQLDNGNRERGQAIYQREALACVVCHAIGGEGGVIGPDLSSIGASAPADYLIESLIGPSKKIKEGYRMTIVTAKNDDVFSGAVLREDQNVLVLRNAAGSEIRVPKSTIKSRETSPVSLMPSGLTASLREDELIDLVAYLASLGKQG